MARKHMAPPEASRSRSLRPLATTVPRRTEHPTKLAASVCPHRRHLNPSPRHRSSQGAKLQERSIGSWQRAMAWLLSHPRSGTARKDPQANAAMMALRSHHYENIDILQHPSEENLSQPCIAGPRVPRPDAAVPASPAVKSAQSRRLRAKRRESQTVNKSLTAGWHRRVEAESLDPGPLHSSPLTLDSLRRAHPLTEAIRRDRSKSGESVCIQTLSELLLAVIPHDRQSNFNEQLEIAN